MANVAALVVFDAAFAAGLSDGVVVAMRSVLDNWRLDRASTATPNAISVVASVSGGNWMRDEVHSLEWRMQQTWHIDAAGNDENDGLTGATALATHPELNRRLGFGPVYGFPTVNINSDLTGNIVIQAAPLDAFGGYTYVGQRTLLYSGSVTAHTAFDPATNTPGSITDTAIPVTWTASGLLNALVTLTSGANAGASAWVATEVGAKVARTSPFWNFGYVEPAVTDTFDVTQPTIIDGRLDMSIPFGQVILSDMRFNPSGGGPSMITTAAGQLGPFYCDFVGDSVLVGSGAFVNFLCNQLRPLVGGVQIDNSVGFLDGCLITRNGKPLVYDGGIIQIDTPTLAQGIGADSVGFTARLGGVISFLSGGWLCMCDDITSNAGLTIAVSSAAALNDFLWGTGNTVAYGVRVDSDGSVVYATGKAPKLITPATAQTQIGGTNTTYAALPYVEANNGAQIVVGQFI